MKLRRHAAGLSDHDADGGDDRYTLVNREWKTLRFIKLWHTNYIRKSVGMAFKKFKKSRVWVSLWLMQERNYWESRIGITPMRILIALMAKLNVNLPDRERDGIHSNYNTILWTGSSELHVLNRKDAFSWVRLLSLSQKRTWRTRKGAGSRCFREAARDLWNDRKVR